MTCPKLFIPITHKLCRWATILFICGTLCHINSGMHILHNALRPKRIRIASHNASDKVILPRLFQIWRHFQVAPVYGRRVLDVQLKQSNFMTSTENVNKLCLFVQETEHLQVKLTMMVCPERISNVYNFTDVGFILIQHSGSMS